METIGSSAQAKTLAWIFLGRIFTLDYIGEENSGKLHGYVLDDSQIVTGGLSSADLRIKGANLDEQGTRFAFVNEVCSDALWYP